MDTHDRKVIDILGDQKRFIVPFYQRHYKWTEHLWLSFWEDVRSKAEEALFSKPKFDHYMGALILAPESYSVAVTPRLLVVDGQQRLTTFQLFLIAMREVGDQLDCPEIGESAKNYLFNNPMTGDIGHDVKFKLAPNRADRSVFYQLAENGLDAVRVENPDWFYKNGRFIKKYTPNTVRAAAVFKSYIHQWVTTGLVEELSDDDETNASDVPIQIDDEEEQVKVRLQALMSALLSHLKLVVITLGEDDDAQVIFETLNSKNEPLTAMELVRNYIFQRAAADSDSSEKLFEERWQPLEEAFWNEIAPRARPRRPRVDHYLGNTLTAETGEEVSLRELYAEYRSFARPNGNSKFITVKDELDTLLKYVPVYKSLEGDGADADLIWLGEKLASWEVTTAFPVAFAVGASKVEKEEKRIIYELINSYIVRRAICDLTPKNLNKNFQKIVANLLTEGISAANFINAFNQLTGASTRFPPDEEFHQAIVEKPLYRQIHRKERLRDFLWEIELKSRDKYSIDTPKPDSMSIEHLMPQSWFEHWPLPSGQFINATSFSDGLHNFDEKTTAEIENRQSAMHTLGNLTLVTVPANTKLSNSEFSKKKTWLQKSLLAMNFAIAENGSWSEKSIRDRGEAMADMAIQIWPGIND